MGFMLIGKVINIEIYVTGINIWIVIGTNGITSPAWDTNWNIPSSVIKHGWC